MAIIPLEPDIPDLGISRMEPCSAINGLNNVCGATPAAKYRKDCGVSAHAEYVALCPVHAAICVSGGGICRACYRNGGVVPVHLIRLDNRPMRIL